MSKLDYIRVVLIQPSHPGNIGAVARAMGNMGISKLMLVNPADFPSPIANARAAGADYILEQAVVVDSLDTAIADCELVVGTTARSRSIQWPEVAPAVAAGRVVTSPQRETAVLFGRESSGMTNDELERCQFLIRIPVNEAFSSLNLGSAVTVILYEIRKQFIAQEYSDPDVTGKNEKLATAEELRHFYQHLEEFVTKIEFSDGRSMKLHRKMAKLFNRAEMNAQEVRMLRGLFTSVSDKLDGKY